MAVRQPQPKHTVSRELDGLLYERLRQNVHVAHALSAWHANEALAAVPAPDPVRAVWHGIVSRRFAEHATALNVIPGAEDVDIAAFQRRVACVTKAMYEGQTWPKDYESSECLGEMK